MTLYRSVTNKYSTLSECYGGTDRRCGFYGAFAAGGFGFNQITNRERQREVQTRKSICHDTRRSETPYFDATGVDSGTA